MKTKFWTVLTAGCVLGIVTTMDAQEKNKPIKVCLVAGSSEYEPEVSLAVTVDEIERPQPVDAYGPAGAEARRARVESLGQVGAARRDDRRVRRVVGCLVGRRIEHDRDDVVPGLRGQAR